MTDIAVRQSVIIQHPLFAISIDERHPSLSVPNMFIVTGTVACEDKEERRKGTKEVWNLMSC